MRSEGEKMLWGGGKKVINTGEEDVKRWKRAGCDCNGICTTDCGDSRFGGERRRKVSVFERATN
jgi:hypothetical protein